MRAQFTHEETEAQGVEMILLGHATARVEFEPKSVPGLKEMDVPSSFPPLLPLRSEFAPGTHLLIQLNSIQFLCARVCARPELRRVRGAAVARSG